MTTPTRTRVFKSGNSQTVRIPREFKLEVDEVEIIKRDDELVLRKIKDDLSDVMGIFESFSDDFMQDGREDTPPQERNFDL